MKNLIILKLGGSVITEKSKPFTVNYNNLNRLVKEISNALNSSNFSLILIHGAGSFGHTTVAKYGIDKGIKTRKQVFGFAETQKVQEELNNIVVQTLQDQGLPAIPCQPSSHAIMRSGKLSQIFLDSIKGFLEIGLIPVLYGVPAYDEDRGCSILSGDEIASHIAKKLEAKRVIFGVDTDGILDYNNKLIEEITPEKFKKMKKYVKGSKATDVTGGMLGKLEKISILAGTGTEVEIVNANKPSIIERGLKGERGLGTLIR